MMIRRGFIGIVAFLPLAESLQHFGRRDSVASAMLDTEYFLSLHDLHHCNGHWIADRLVLVDP